MDISRLHDLGSTHFVCPSSSASFEIIKCTGVFDTNKNAVSRTKIVPAHFLVRDLPLKFDIISAHLNLGS